MASPTRSEIARDIAISLLAKSGVREWGDPDAQEAISNAAVNMADFIWLYTNGGGPSMAITAAFRKQFATPITFKKSGGTGAMTPSTLANGSYWQSAKIDLGNANGCLAQAYSVDLAVDLAATPTAGSTIDFYWNPSTSGTAGTDNKGGASGTDSSYTGYSSNAAASVPQLQFIGSMVCTTQTSLQKGIAGILVPQQRYGSLVMCNNSGAAFASDTNFVVTLSPEEPTAEAA